MSDARPISYAALLSALRIADPPARWARGWESARARGDAAFLAPAAVAELADACAFPDDVAAPLFAAVAAVRADPALRALAWLWHVMLFHDDDGAEADYAGWPPPPAAGAQVARLFPAVVVFTGLGHMRALHRARQIPAAVTRDTAADLAVWMRHCRRLTGAWGFAQLPWMLRHCRGQLFRLGRLQFEPLAFAGDLRAFRRRADGRVVALAAAGTAYRRDGLVNGTNDDFDDGAWTAEYAADDTGYTGNPIAPAGVARPEPVTLPAAEWAPALVPGDPVWNVHIPEDGKMDFTRCGEAFRQAADFFPRYFPETPPAAAFVIGTWLLDPQLQRILPAASNIVRFQREFYLSPALSYQREPFWRVFGAMPPDLAAAPRDTALRRAMLDYTLAGGRLGCANGFILRDDLAWGTQRYQKGTV